MGSPNKMLDVEEFASLSDKERTEELQARMVDPGELPESIREKLADGIEAHAAAKEANSVRR